MSKFNLRCEPRVGNPQGLEQHPGVPKMREGLWGPAMEGCSKPNVLDRKDSGHKYYHPPSSCRSATYASLSPEPSELGLEVCVQEGTEISYTGQPSGTLEGHPHFL
jgi:hypothetical protein